MCGLLGNFGYVETQEFLHHISEVEPLLKRRGPDQTDSIDIENFYGVHSRLIIQGDASDGKQPMVYKDIVLLFNGNLYNKDALKSELQTKGYEFKGISDTEVVAISIFHWGNKAFERFNGFFSIVYFNSKNKERNFCQGVRSIRNWLFQFRFCRIKIVVFNFSHCRLFMALSNFNQ